MEEIDEMREKLKPILKGETDDHDAIREVVEDIDAQLIALKRRWSNAVEELTHKKQKTVETFEQKVAKWDATHAKELGEFIDSFQTVIRYEFTDTVLASAFVMRALGKGWNVFIVENENGYTVIYRENTTVFCSGTSPPRFRQCMLCSSSTKEQQLESLQSIFDIK